MLVSLLWILSHAVYFHANQLVIFHFKPMHDIRHLPERLHRQKRLRGPRGGVLPGGGAVALDQGLGSGQRRAVVGPGEPGHPRATRRHGKCMRLCPRTYVSSEVKCSGCRTTPHYARTRPGVSSVSCTAQGIGTFCYSIQSIPAILLSLLLSLLYSAILLFYSLYYHSYCACLHARWP